VEDRFEEMSTINPPATPEKSLNGTTSPPPSPSLNGVTVGISLVSILQGELKNLATEARKKFPNVKEVITILLDSEILFYTRGNLHIIVLLKMQFVCNYNETHFDKSIVLCNKTFWK
jgi:hypothetical protein